MKWIYVSIIRNSRLSCIFSLSVISVKLGLCQTFYTNETDVDVLLLDPTSFLFLDGEGFG